MFWKILLDRILGINISKCNELEKNCEFSESLRSVARLWQSDMLQEVNFVQNTSLWKACNDSRRRTCSFPHCQGPYCIKDYNCNSCPETYVIKPPCQKKTSRSTCIRTKTIDCGCTASCANVENKIYAYKNKIKRLQAKFNIQNDDLKKLRNENCMLRKEVEHVCLSCPWKASFFLPKGKIGCCHSVTVVPKPFECHVQDNCCPVSNIYSEMIITMKNGKNEVNTKALCLFMYQTADDAHVSLFVCICLNMQIPTVLHRCCYVQHGIIYCFTEF